MSRRGLNEAERLSSSVRSRGAMGDRNRGVKAKALGGAAAAQDSMLSAE